MFKPLLTLVLFIAEIMNALSWLIWLPIRISIDIVLAVAYILLSFLEWIWEWSIIIVIDSWKWIKDYYKL